MSGFEYKVVPAPMRGLKAKGVKGTQARFANALETLMNEYGAEGWEYQRTDTLPVEERQGLTGKTTTFQNMLVFRRALSAQIQEPVEVAALIEDQSDAIEPEVIVEEPASEDIAAVEETVEDNVVEMPQAEPAPAADASETGLSADARERVAETLKGPVRFPWNRRAATKPASSDDTRPSAD